MKDTPKKVRKLSEKELPEKELTDKEASSVVGGYRPLRTDSGTNDVGTRGEGINEQLGDKVFGGTLGGKTVGGEFDLEGAFTEMADKCGTKEESALTANGVIFPTVVNTHG